MKIFLPPNGDKYVLGAFSAPTRGARAGENISNGRLTMKIFVVFFAAGVMLLTGCAALVGGSDYDARRGKSLDRDGPECCPCAHYRKRNPRAPRSKKLRAPESQKREE